MFKGVEVGLVFLLFITIYSVKILTRKDHFLFYTTSNKADIVSQYIGCMQQTSLMQAEKTIIVYYY